MTEIIADVTIPELFADRKMKVAYIDEFRIKALPSGNAFGVCHRFVKTPNDFGGDSMLYVGTIFSDGTFRPKVMQYAAKVRETIANVYAEGVAYLVRNGKELGSCSFCGLELSDPESVSYGYGPVCAKKHNLPHGNRHGF